MGTVSLRTTKPGTLRTHWVVYAAICFVFYWLFIHPDVMETANHAYLFLESVFSGRLPHFYLDVMAHQNTLYYINNAHYNIVVYAIFAVFELPIFIFHAISRTAVNEAALYFCGKLVGMVFWFGSIAVFARVADALGLNQTSGRHATLFFALFPPAFFSVAAMGQYDSICLFFTLLALLYWLRGRYGLFAIWMGVGAACKFFPLMLLLPLVLLFEKRPLHVVKYGLISLWLLAPTSLLFMGRTGDMAAFTNVMISRLFAAKLPAAADVAIFPLLYAVVCIAAWLWRPGEESRKQAGMWLCLAVYGLLFLFVGWHPQWVILLAPFLVLTTFMEKQRSGWFWADLVLSAGFFLYCAITHPHQLEANLLDYGLVGILSGLRTNSAAFAEYNPILFYLLLLPVVAALPMVLFGGAVTAHAALKFPAKNGTPAARLAGGGEDPPAKQLPAYAWFVFAAGLAVWLLPTIFTWLKCFGFV